ncbi:MAG: TIGR01777 family oxidoreductase [Pirellulaceae bacterium]|nr:TIGR01777 family oxidoreductase [Pirellulaceae bacterium]
MTTSFERQLQLPVSAQQAFAWHERLGALDRLIPPWERVSIQHRGDGIKDGSIVELVQRIGPFRLKWVAKHHGFQAGKTFRDTQLSGPFAKWEHFHGFRENADGNGALTDRIEYRLPGGFVGSLLGGAVIKQKIEAMFTYRHNTTRDDLAAHAKHKELGTMHIAVSGASGLVGSTLVPMLTTGGHTVTKLVRRAPGEGEATWDPQGKSDASSLEGIDAVVHLAGESIAASRWSAKVKDRIRSSRVQGTRALCESLAKMKSPPRVLVCASAIGYYGDRGDEILTEDSVAGQGFLADVAQEWEAATQPASAAGIRVVNLRFGVILSPKGGALAKMLLPFKLGIGGRVGSGKQYWSWISIDDAAGAVHHALMTDSLSGPVNGVAPNPVTNLEFTTTLGRVLRRPTIVPIPVSAARLALGEMADALLLASVRVEPKKLIRTGYEFRQPTLETAFRHLLGKTKSTTINVG